MGSLFLYVALAIGAIAGGGLMVGVEKLIVQPMAISKAVDAARAECVAQVRAQTAEALLAQFDEARQAELGIGPTPIDKAELQMLCDRDLACREHKR